MIFIVIRLYINFSFSCLLCENYRLYKHTKATEKDKIISKICIFNSSFLAGIMLINTYYLFNNIKYYLH